MSAPTSLAPRFRANLLGLGVRPGQRLLVAVSGGCDSVVLLHLLRFACRELELVLTAAHFDHAMRPDSARDLSWVRGLCAAWGVPLAAGRHAGEPLRGEEGARDARYAFLRRAAAEAGAQAILTAHQADDQAETVLFRLLRGTGLRGLAGIPAASVGGVIRPLLPFWRREIERYARGARLRWRVDPTNRSLLPARNRIRHSILPEIERRVAPQARRRLVELATVAREAEAALEQLLEPLREALVRRDGEAFVLARARLRDYDSAVGSQLLRHLLRQFGVVPSRSGTRMALQFITDAPSGRELQLPGGVRLRTEYDSARLERAREVPPDLPVSLAGAPPADTEREARLRIGGREYRVRWGRGAALDDGGAEGWSVALPGEGLRFPLALRGWRPGDRLRTTAGRRPLKKLFGEERVARSRRAQLPVLVDAAGEGLWVGGLSRGTSARLVPGDAFLLLTVADD